MTKLHLIAHCWSVARDCYAKMLTAQLTSLLRWPPKCDVTLSICTAADDRQTLTAIANFQSRGVQVVAEVFPLSKLLRRAIARNELSKLSRADIVWFTDCDLMFGEGCLDTLASLSFTGLAYPRQQLIHRSHATGDRELKRIVLGEPFDADLSLFQPHKMRMASGGVQIVDGVTARLGYLDGTRWVKPVDPSGDFVDPKEDKVFRSTFPSSTGLDMPNLYRFRHSDCPFQSAASRLAQTDGKV